MLLCKGVIDNNQIRLSILSQFYMAMFNGEGGPRVNDNPELKGISEPVITANLVYLLDKGLINGEKRYADSGRAVVFTSDITAKGMDIIESIINQSIDKLEPQISAEIKTENTTPKRFEKLNDVCQKNAPILDVVIKVAGIIFSNLR